MNQPDVCLICGAPLVYTSESQPMKCIGCGNESLSNAQCENGHFVCDKCHSDAGRLAIAYFCRHTSSKNPLEIAKELMNHPSIHMHGPEHHALVGCALLAAYHNAGGKIDLDKAIDEMLLRSQQVPGGACGFWGACGAGISAGMFYSIISDTTPLSESTWGNSMEMTAACLQAIGSVGGPRCCKRDSFLSIKTAVNFVKEHCAVVMEQTEPFVCIFSHRNHECLGKRCPFSPLHQLNSKI